VKFASIDIGSNAVRLFLAQVLNNGNPFVSKDSLIRIPVRLGEDTFINGSISEEKKEKLITMMIGFKYLIEAYKPVDFMACATSAMREAQNAESIIKEIRDKSGVEIIVLDGKKEAEIICSGNIKSILPSYKSYLYIDVGGGSTEMTLFSNKRAVISESFKIGTVRMINNRVKTAEWASLKGWIKEYTNKYQPVEAIGSGGNINKLYKLSGKSKQTYLSYNKVKKIYGFLDSFSYDQRIRVLNLHADRADVIIPATTIFLKIMKWASVSKIHVPQFGLSDGIIRVLYNKHDTKQAF